MALTLVKEDGSARADANSYASVADADAYHEGHLYATAWTAASVTNRAKALVFATRLIDAHYRFNGWRVSEPQALEWPRDWCMDPDLPSADWVANDLVPRAVVEATCEMARELLIADRTAAPAGEGIDYRLDGPTSVKYSKTDTPPVISHVTQAMLSKFGTLVSGRSGPVRLVRT
jgi:hypothetical protein